MKKVLIYTDGSCLGNPGPGGWGAVLMYQEHQTLLSGGELKTTNNRMELLAAIEAIHHLKEPCQIDLFTDSIYVQRGMTEWIHGWRKNEWRNSQKKPIKNVDLWQKLNHSVSIHQINWYWVKGHSGNPFNELADKLATEAAAEMLKRVK